MKELKLVLLEDTVIIEKKEETYSAYAMACGTSGGAGCASCGCGGGGR